MAFADRQNGFAVGRDRILRSVDGGETWNAQTGIELPDFATRGVSFSKVRFQDRQHGFLLGTGVAEERCSPFGFSAAGFVLSTENGGETWRPAAVSSAIPLLRCDGSASSICFTPEGVGLIAGNPPLLSRDDGRTWFNIEELVEPSGDGPRWDSVQFSPQAAACQPDGRLWLATARQVYGSIDDGLTWTLLDDDFNDSAGYLSDLAFRDAEEGLLSAGGLFRTEDGGLSWTRVDNATNGFGTLSTAFVTNTDLLSTSYNFVTVSHDAGATWDLVQGITLVPDKIFSLGDIAVVD